jgi:FAD binding domain
VGQPSVSDDAQSHQTRGCVARPLRNFGELRTGFKSMNQVLNLETDLLVIGGGTAGCVAAVKAKEALPDGTVLLLEKANVRRSGHRIGHGWS